MKAERVKRERMSGFSGVGRGEVEETQWVPWGTQRTTTEGATVVELDDDSENDDDASMR